MQNKMILRSITCPNKKSIVDCSTLTRPDWEQLFSVFKFKNNTKIKKPGSYTDCVFKIASKLSYFHTIPVYKTAL
jgi:hypothetical protein